MKDRRYCLVAALLVVGLGATQAIGAMTDVISVNFIHANDNHPLAAGESAGVVSVANWNNVTVVPALADQPDNYVTGIALVDSEGDALAATLGYSAGTSADRATGDVDPASGPDFKMMGSTFFGNKGKNGTVDTGKNEFFELTGIDSAFAAAGYTLYIYYSNTSSGGGGDFDVDLGIDSSKDFTTLTFNRDGPTFSGAFVEVVDADKQGNYLKIDGLTATSFRATIHQRSGAESGVAGIQLVPVPVPEPATLALLAIGGLAALRRR